MEQTRLAEQRDTRRHGWAGKGGRLVVGGVACLLQVPLQELRGHGPTATGLVTGITEDQLEWLAVKVA